MRRRSALVLLVCALVAAVLALVPTGGATATPTAFDDATYSAYGRVFPDPHGCVRGAPGKSPWAKGNVCAVQFLQWNEALDGLHYLEQRFPRYLEVINLRTQYGELSELDGEELQSAGLPREDLTRDRRDLYVVKVTDHDSAVPEADRRHFAYSLSIHGIERAGIEGGIRAVEDLVTWAACEEDPEAAGACAAEGPFPKKILEPSDSGPTAGEVVRDGVVYFVLSNPDGWHRGEWSEGGVFFQRYNGNGMDLNRDWASVGYTEEQYTPFSEPETRGYAKFLEHVAGKTSDKKFAGAIDLHGMLTAPSFSFTLLGAGQRDYRKNAITVDTAITTFRDSEQRLAWSPLIAPSDSCPGPVSVPEFGGNVPMCSDQWGTVWDTINYQVTGSFGDWMDSPMGLDAVGIDNEMALSHLTPNNVFDPGVEQLHIDGNKGLIYAQIASLLFEKPVQFKPSGKVAYVTDPARTSDPGGAPADGGTQDLPTQDDIEAVSLNGIQNFEFEVKGPSDGVDNGGLTVEADFGNVRGISPATAGELTLEYCGAGEHVGDAEGECREVAHYFNQSELYLQAGARIDLNDPKPGPYRIVSNPARALPTKFHVSFDKGQAIPVPDQAPYDVSRTDFFEELNTYTPAKGRLAAVKAADIANGTRLLDRYDTVVVADRFAPGGLSAKQQGRYAAALKRFVERGGNLVLTDGALGGLPSLVPGIGADKVKSGVYYAGWMDFADAEGETYERHPLAKGVNKEGTAEGVDSVGDETFEHRHQTYEPVPLGFYVDQSGSANADCTQARCDSPNWVVDQAAWEAAGGSTAARTLARLGTEPEDEGTVTGTSLGELRLGKGVIRMAGALLPEPTEQNYHPFGLSSYALTYTGYQVFENLVAYQRPR
jgi:hypothetical protein